MLAPWKANFSKCECGVMRCSLMKSIYQVEVALVSLVNAQELSFLARAGEWPESIPRAGSFCDWIFVAPTPNLLIFEDLAQDIRCAGRLGLATSGT
jgi:hypothetical protein